MKIKNFQKNQNSSSENKIDKAVLQTLLLTDGSVIPERNQISFANTSEELVNQFCNLVNSVYGYEIPKSRIGFGKGTKQKLYIVQFKSKEICRDLLKEMSYNTSKDVSIPGYWFDFSEQEKTKILRTMFDTEGGCSLRLVWLKKKNCFEVKREVFISCENQKLRRQFRLLVESLGIKTGESSGKVTITNRRDIEKFRNAVNFSPNVKVGFDSKVWHGIEKRRLLDILLETYKLSRGVPQTFKNKEDFYDFMASFQVNTVRES